MLDIKYFREKPARVKKSEKKRGHKLKHTKDVIKYDKKWREAKKKLDKLRAKRNKVSEEINKAKKKGKSAKTKIKSMKKVAKQIKAEEKKVDKYLKKRDAARKHVGNILHKSVPKGGEEDSKTIRKYGKRTRFKFKPKAHADLVKSLGVADTNTAAKVSGARFYYLKNELVKLNLALIQFALDKMVKKGFTPMWTPFLLRKKVMSEAAELSDFEDMLYKIDGENLFLIATSEQTLAALHRNQIVDKKELPKKYVGFSSCFRKEAGTHGKDTKGIFRVHQFDKVEQYIFCKPKNSWKIHEKMIRNAEEVFKDLKLPYRVVDIASEDMNDNAARKYDIEAWFPAQKAYREVVSCSNCTDYQARKLKIRYGKAGNSEGILHTLNSTVVATQRAICAILENFQRKDGSVKIPRKLRKYTGFKWIRPKK